MSTLGSQVEHLAQILQRGSAAERSVTEGRLDELNDFAADIKQAKAQLISCSQRWQDATFKEESLEQREAEMKKREELLEQKTAETTREQELLEQKAAEMTKREELLERKAAEMTRREELLEQRTADVTKREELSEQQAVFLEKTSQDLKNSIKIYNINDEHVKKHVEILKAREADVTKSEDNLEKHKDTIEQRRKADEEMIRRREDNLKHARESLDHHQQIVIQLHQETKEKLDTIRQERADDKRQKADMITYNVGISNQLKAEAAKVQGLIKTLQKLKSSIAAPLQKCEAALADMKGRAQSLNLFEAEQRREIASLNNDLARISTSTDKYSAAINSISEDMQAIDTNLTRLMSRQFEEISAKLANVSEVSSGLETLSTKFQEMQVAEPNATESMNGAAEELRNATETGSKAREALQKVIVRQNASRFSTKRGPVLSSPEKPAPKRRQIRGGSAGAAEVLTNVESNELIANTPQTFGSPSRRRRPFTPFTGHMTASRSGVSSPAPNPIPATRQDLTLNPVSSSRDTLVPPGQGADSATDPSGLSVASEHVRNVWRQIEFPVDWTAADADKLLVQFNEAKARKGGKNNRYWPQQAMDMGANATTPYCLMRDLRRSGMMAPPDGRRCESHSPNQLCIDVFYTTDNPGEYDSAATDKRWRLIKRV